MRDADLINQARRRLAALDLERSKLVIELISYGQNPSQDPDTSAAKAVFRTTKSWDLILERLAGFRHFRANDVMRVSHELWREEKIRRYLNHDAARAQLSQLTKKGLLKRLGGGNYRLSDQAKEQFASQAKKELG